MSNEKNRLIWFYGKECPHCRALMPMVEKYQQESNINIEHLEVWHNEENAKFMRSHADKISEACGGELGVPAFYNEKTGKALCGARIPVEKLKQWAEE